MVRNPFRRRTAEALPPEDRIHVPETEEVHKRLAKEQEAARQRLITAEAEINRVRGKLQRGHQ